MFMLCFTGITQTALALLLLIRPLTVMTAFQLIPECEFPNKHSLTLTLYAPSLFPKHPLSNSRIPTLSFAYSRITNSIRNRRLPFCEIEYFKAQIKKNRNKFPGSWIWAAVVAQCYVHFLELGHQGVSFYQEQHGT